MYSVGKLTVKGILRVFLITLIGSGIVFISMALMNRGSLDPESEDIGPTVSFEVPPPPKTQKKTQKREEKRREVNTEQPALAPLPDLGSNLSGIAVAMPGFEAKGVSDVSESLLGNLEDVALTENAVDTPPSPRNRVMPIYPERAKQREIEGKVVISVLVGADGQVKNMKIIESNPPGMFETAVKNAISQWTFVPASYKGNPTRTWVNIPFPFNLN